MTISVSSQALNNENLEIIRQSCLEAHNDLRAKHDAPPLMMNTRLTNLSQNFVQYLADNQLFFHSPESKRGEIGENLYYRCERPSQPNITSTCQKELSYLT
jgi:uncharacterized protein YkwD